MCFNFNGGNVDSETMQIRNLQTARLNFLIVAAFTLINVILAALGGDYYFLFSSFIPHYLTLIAVYANDVVLLVCMVAVAVLFIAFYVLCWWMSKTKPKLWLSVALAVFAVDTVFMFIVCRNFLADMIVDIVFHVWVIVYLIIGVVAASKLKKMAMATQDNAGQIEPEFTEIDDGAITESVSEDSEPVVGETLSDGEDRSDDE